MRFLLKKTNWLLFAFFVSFSSTKAYANTDSNIFNPFDKNNKKNSNDFEVKTNFSFGYDYNFGFAKVDSGKVLKEKNDTLTLDDRFRNTLYVNDFDLIVKNTFFDIVKTTVSTSVVSTGFNAEPLLNVDAYRNYNSFLNDRKNNLKNLWQRFLIIKDVQFEIKDPTTNGNMIIGQQLIPFGYNSESTLNKPVSNYPILTPMTEYINFNLREDNSLPYQNSTMSDIRDIGFSLNGNYPYFRFNAGLYNGSGPNTFDDNNEKDLFGKADLILGNFETGISHLRGKHIGYKNIYDNAPKRDELELAKTGFHGKLGDKNAYLQGEYILAQDNWSDKTIIDKNGWYIEGVVKAEDVFSGSLRFETFYDNNVLKNKEKNVNYNIKKVVGSFAQNIGPNIISKQEYSHIWEDLSDSGKKSTVNYGIITANLQFKF